MIRLRTLSVFALALLVAAPLRAQTSGPLVDYREETRLLIQRLGDYARSLDRNFAVLVRDGLELMEKIEDGDETRRAPARAYIRSLDGLMVQGYFVGERAFGRETEAERRAQLDPMLALVRQAGLPILSFDLTGDDARLKKVYGEAQAKGFIPFVADNPFVNNLPAYPPRPLGENPDSILSLSQVKNYLMIEDSAPFGSQGQYAFKLNDLNNDMVIVDVMHGREPLKRGAIERIRYKKVGAKRLVLARVDISQAATWQYFWQPDWKEGSPYWISGPKPGYPDTHYVEFWRPEWQAILFGNTSSYIYGLMWLGFDGVVLEGLDAWRYFEGGGEEGLQQ